jgi:hypothetical protein
MKANNKQIKFVVELGILKTIQDHLKEPLKPGRLRSAFFEVEHLVGIELTKIYQKDPNFFPDNKSAIAYYLHEFGKKANWIDNETHVASVVSFCLAFLETSEYKYPEKLFENLNKIVDYYERAGFISYKDLTNAEDFENIWKNIPDYPEHIN